MYEAAVATGAALLATYGPAVLLVAFVLEGAFVGKLIPTRALFIGAVLALGSDAVGVATVFVAAVVGATIGQLTVFWLVRRTGLDVEDIPGPIDPATDGRLEHWFDRWGLPAVALSNSVPVARGSLVVPAAMTDTGTLRFSSAAVVGTSTYAGALVALAVGVDALLVAF